MAQIHLLNEAFNKKFESLLTEAATNLTIPVDEMRDYFIALADSRTPNPFYWDEANDDLSKKVIKLLNKAGYFDGDDDYVQLHWTEMVEPYLTDDEMAKIYSGNSGVRKVDGYFVFDDLYEGSCNSSKSKKQLKESDDVRHYSDMLFDMIEEGIADAESIAKDLIYWCSEDDIEHYMRVNGYLDYENDEEYDESLKEGTYSNLRTKKDAGAQKKVKSLKEAFVFLNNIDKDILDGSKDKNALKLMTNNSIKCSKSAINNLKFLLKRGHDASLCLGQLKKKDEDASNVISHVWVKYGDDIIQTHVPANLDSDVWETYCVKEIKFNPSDLDDIESFHDKVLSALNESSTEE